MANPLLAGPGVRVAFAEGRGLIAWTGGNDPATRAVRAEVVGSDGAPTDRRTITPLGMPAQLSDLAAAPGHGASSGRSPGIWPGTTAPSATPSSS